MNENNLDSVIREAADEAGELRRKAAERFQNAIVLDRCFMCMKSAKFGKKGNCGAETDLQREVCPMRT